jgi:hypothetical protein
VTEETSLDETDGRHALSACPNDKDQEGGVLDRYCEQVRLINGGFGNVFQMDYVEGM